MTIQISKYNIRILFYIICANTVWPNIDISILIPFFKNNFDKELLRVFMWVEIQLQSKTDLNH